MKSYLKFDFDNDVSESRTIRNVKSNYVPYMEIVESCNL